MEIAEEIGIPKEEIVYAMDAIQTPMSLYDPVYTEGGDTLYVMDQISDKKNREENWIEVLALNEAVKNADRTGTADHPSAFLMKERHRWKWQI